MIERRIVFVQIATTLFPWQVITRPCGKGNERHVAERHVTISQSSTWSMSHHSDVILNTGREVGTNEIYHLERMMVEESRRENHAHAD